MARTKTVPGVTRHPEGSHYRWDGRETFGAHHQLVTMAERPSAAEVRAFRGAPHGEAVRLALLVDGPVLLLCWRSAGWPWSEAPYSWHVQAAATHLGALGVPSTEPLPPGTGARFDLVLVDASNGKVAGLRQTTLPGPFATRLHRAIVAQSEAPWDARAYDARLAHLLARPTDELARRAQATCTIGEGGGGPAS